MIDPNVLSLPEWLRQFGMLVGGDLPMDDAVERLRAYGAALNADFAPSVFTADSARHVARTANPKGFFPRYAEVAAALTEWAKANPVKPARPAIEGPAKAGAGHWHGFIAARLVAGGDRAHLLSLARQYATPDELRGILAAFYPAEAQAEADHAVEVRRDKARGAEAVAKAVARSLTSKRPTLRSAMPEPEAPKPAVDPHATGRPLTLPELHAKLIRIQREAASPDPPPNAAERIVQLQQRIAALSGPGGSA